MTRSDLIEVLSFVPGFTTDMLTSLPSERLVEIYSDYFEGQEVKKLDLIIEALTEASQIVATGNWGTDYYACCGADIDLDHLDDCIIM